VKKSLILISLIIIVFLSVFFIPKNMKKVCFKNTCFNVELAISSAEKEKGLMFRDNLKNDAGMLFVYEREGMYSFWMKNTKITLDIIWIDSDFKVAFISENTEPCVSDICQSINPGINAKYVLEINAGTVEKLGMKVNDKLDFKL